MDLKTVMLLLAVGSFLFGLLLIMFKFNKNNPITFANTNMASMLGYTVEEMLGRAYVSFFPESQLVKIAEKIRQRIQELKIEHRKSSVSEYVTEALVLLQLGIRRKFP